jgi:hypothetical protein
MPSLSVMSFSLFHLGAFSDADFSNEGCAPIPSVVIDEAKHFVTFMSSMVEELLGNESFVANILKTAKLEEEG